MTVRKATELERVELLRQSHAVDASGRCRRCQCHPASCDVLFLLDVLVDVATVAAEILTEPEASSR